MNETLHTVNETVGASARASNLRQTVSALSVSGGNVFVEGRRDTGKAHIAALRHAPGSPRTGRLVPIDRTPLSRLSIAERVVDAGRLLDLDWRALARRVTESGLRPMRYATLQEDYDDSEDQHWRAA